MSKVVVSGAAAGLQQQIKVGNHNLVADAPKEAGGHDAGLNPHELLLASLGACTAMTLRIFAGKRSWDLKDVEVILEESQVEDAEGKKKTVIAREIKVTGQLDQEQLDTLKNIADKCPIHKLLAGQTEVSTQLKSATGAAK